LYFFYREARRDAISKIAVLSVEYFKQPRRWLSVSETHRVLE